MCNCNGQCKKERFVIADELLNSFEAGYNIGKDHGEEEATEHFLSLFKDVEEEVRHFIHGRKIEAKEAILISAQIAWIFQKRVWNNYCKGGEEC